VLAFSLTMIE